MKDFQTRDKRLGKRDYSADFRTADSDDFFGFSVSYADKPMAWVAIAVTTIAIILCGWIIIANAQQECLANNEGNITLCE